eukprot:g780.t1
MLSKLSTDRATEEDSWKSVGEACAAVDLAGGAAEVHGIWSEKRNDIHGVFQTWKEKNKTTPRKTFELFWSETRNPRFVSLGSAFSEWTKKNHVFLNVTISKAYAHKMSSYMRELMDENPDQTWNLSSLKYTYPNLKARNATAQSLSNDEKLKNKLFVKLARASWRECCFAAVTAATERLENVDASMSNERSRSPKKRRQVNDDEGDTKVSASEDDIAPSSKFGGEDDEEDDGPGKDSKVPADDEEVAAMSSKRPEREDVSETMRLEISTTRARKRVLTSLGVRRLARWVERDEDDAAEAERKRKETRITRSRRQHTKWVERKNKLRIRLPSRGIDTSKQRPQRFDFSKRGLARGSRQTHKTTTVDLLGNLGLKYVHATGRKTANNRDLMESRAQLAKAGVVLKENFRDEDGDFVEDAYNDLLKTTKRTRGNRKTSSDRPKLVAKSEKHREWLEAKRNQEKAIDYLHAIPPPSDSGADTTNYLREIGDADGDGKLSPEERWIAVGRALKGINQGLLSSWITWSKTFRSAYVCTGYWHSFRPVACDVHAVGSVVRDTMLKLLHRKDVDFKACFEAAYRDVKARDARRSGHDLDREAVESALETLDAAMPNKDFKRMLKKRLGLSLSKAKLNRIVRSLDSNDDGNVSMEEWIHFTDSSNGVQERLSKRCVWEEACHICGMPHAYALSSICEEATSSESPRSKRNREKRESKLADVEEDDDDADFENEDDVNEKTASSGRLPKRVETDDHRRLVRRVDHVQHLHAKRKGLSPPAICEAAKWNPKRSARMLRELRKMATPRLAAAKAERERAIGTKPLEPNLFVLRYEDDTPKQLTTSLRIGWGEADGSDPVAFFALETCGREGSQTHQRQSWRTVCVDPPSAASQDDPAYEFVMDELRPNAAYHFRIRALNGHGASGYTHAVLATAPSSPATPVVTHAGVSSIDLCWASAKDRRLANQLDRMKELFREIDIDGSGEISRDELRRALRDDKNADLRKMINSTPAAPSEVRSRLTLSQRLKLNATKRETNESADEGPSDDEDRAATNLRKSDGFSVFDMIEQNDDGDLSWDEFVRFFGKRAMKIHRVGGKSRVNKRSSSIATKSVVQTCVSTTDADDSDRSWKDVYVGMDTTCTVKNLKPGRRYRFRVLFVTHEGIESATSDSVVASCQLPAPPIPKLAGDRDDAIAARALQIRVAAGKAAEIVLPMRFKHKGSDVGGADDLLKQWALSSDALRIEREGGVSVRSIFDSFDADGSGSIDARELKNVLAALDAPNDRTAVRRAMTELDTDRSGQIELGEFYRWFESTKLTIVVKRDRGVPCARPPWFVGAGRDETISQLRRANPFNAKDSATDRRKRELLPSPVGGACKVVARCNVTVNAQNVESASTTALIPDLRPNTLYRFWSRVVSNQSSSPLSNPFAILTMPEKLRAPVTTAVGSRWARMRFYPSSTGAHSYLIEVQARGKSKISATRRALSTSSSSWSTVWEGRTTLAEFQGLAPSSSYKVRVVAVNCWGGRSEPSSHVVVRTVDGPKHEVVPTSSNAVDLFRIECTSDTVIGDTVLFTEKVFAVAEVASRRRQRRGRSKIETEPKRKCVGEQTVCALVTQEKWTKTRAHSTSSGVAILRVRGGVRGLSSSLAPLQEMGDSVCDSEAALTKKKDLPDRMLCLRVLWSTASTPVAARHMSESNSVLWRKERQLCHYEMHRLAWIDETARLSYSKQWNEYFGGDRSEYGELDALGAGVARGKRPMKGTISVAQ